MVFAIAILERVKPKPPKGGSKKQLLVNFGLSDPLTQYNRLITKFDFGGGGMYIYRIMFYICANFVVIGLGGDTGG